MANLVKKYVLKSFYFDLLLPVITFWLNNNYMLTKKWLHNDYILLKCNLILIIKLSNK